MLFKIFIIIKKYIKIIMKEAKTYGEILEMDRPKKENAISKMTEEEKEQYNLLKEVDKNRLLEHCGNNKTESITFNKPIKNVKFIPGIGNVTQMM